MLTVVETPLLKRNIFIDIDNEKIIQRFENMKVLHNNLLYIFMLQNWNVIYIYI
jgi:hypothetical protein